MKKHNLRKQQIKENPNIVPPPIVKVGLCKRSQLNLSTLEI